MTVISRRKIRRISTIVLVPVIIAAAKKDKDETIYELADLCYHAMVLMVDAGISVEDVTKELAKRHVVDHKVKQEYMR